MNTLSPKNPFFIGDPNEYETGKKRSNNRQLELEHFAKQYNYWRCMTSEFAINRFPKNNLDKIKRRTGYVYDPTSYEAIRHERFRSNIALIDRVLEQINPYYRPLVKDFVTNEYTIQELKRKYGLEDDKDVLLNQCRLFYFILDKVK